MSDPRAVDPVWLEEVSAALAESEGCEHGYAWKPNCRTCNPATSQSAVHVTDDSTPERDIRPKTTP